MSKFVEATLVLILSVATVSVTSAYLHNASRSGHGLTTLLSEPNAVNQPSPSLSGKSTTPLVSGNGADARSALQTTAGLNSVAQNSSETVSQGPTSMTGHQGSNLINGWSQADIQRFLTIAQKLIHSVTPSDLNHLQAALENGNEATAQAALTSIGNEYLTHSDEVWLATHLAGSKPFGPVDVQLLQQSLEQLKSELTPGEQQLLQNHKLF